MTKFFIVGGAGFIGSHFLDRLLQDETVSKVSIYDNFSSGRQWHYAHHTGSSRFNVFRNDVKNLDSLVTAMQGHDVVIHLASNPDISKAATHPVIDFEEGTLLTQNVVEAMRRTNTKTILYASGSGVYGDLGEIEAQEDHGPLIPISTYGASKLAGEALIASYCFMFGLVGRAFRFGNVVGPKQTHGVGFDFVRKLVSTPSHLDILGDGTQSKSYIHVFDVINAVLTAYKKEKKAFEVYNVATGDYITVREIADLAVECLGISGNKVQYRFSGGSRGWKGDVPVVRLNTDRIKKLGWTCTRSSRQALKESMLSLVKDVREGRIQSGS